MFTKAVKEGSEKESQMLYNESMQRIKRTSWEDDNVWTEKKNNAKNGRLPKWLRTSGLLTAGHL